MHGRVLPAAGSSVAQDLGDALGYEVYEQKTQNEALWANAILSRYPIRAPTANDLGSSSTQWSPGLRVQHPPRRCSVPALPAARHQIWEGAVHRHRRAGGRLGRGDPRPGDRAAARGLGRGGRSDAAFVFGDFNEPSGRDWTEEAVAEATSRSRWTGPARRRSRTRASWTPTARRTPTRSRSPPSPGRRPASRP